MLLFNVLHGRLARQVVLPGKRERVRRYWRTGHGHPGADRAAGRPSRRSRRAAAGGCCINGHVDIEGWRGNAAAVQVRVLDVSAHRRRGRYKVECRGVRHAQFLPTYPLEPHSSMVLLTAPRGLLSMHWQLVGGGRLLVVNSASAPQTLPPRGSVRRHIAEWQCAPRQNIHHPCGQQQIDVCLMHLLPVEQRLIADAAASIGRLCGCTPSTIRTVTYHASTRVRASTRRVHSRPRAPFQNRSALVLVFVCCASCGHDTVCSACSAWENGGDG